VSPVSYLETGVLYCDDNLHRLSQFPDECIDLIYLDPPFFSNRQYEVIWGDEAEVRSFEDRWQGGIHVYVEWMRERVIELHRILKPTGSLYLHCDWHAGHYLKMMLDDIFGQRRFRNEIVWHYSGWNKRLRGKFESRHDTILFYAKGRPEEQVFNSWTRAWASVSEYVQVRKQKVREDEAGRKYVLSDAGAGKRARRYLDEAMATGTYVDDVWEIDKINNSAKELMGYPTQKPEELLRRIIAASSDPTAVVLDPFAGCGTTMVAAQQLGRQWIGIDISPTAVTLMRERMRRVGAPYVKLVGMPVTLEQLRALKPFEFQNWVIQRMHGTHAPRKTSDMGIDGYSFMLHEPVQVKQSESVGRPVVDAFQTAVQRTGKAKGYIVGLSFTKGAHEEAARVKATIGMEIVLVTAAALLRDSPDLVTPEAGLFPADLPLPSPRPADALPTAEELMASANGHEPLTLVAEGSAEYDISN